MVLTLVIISTSFPLERWELWFSLGSAISLESQFSLQCPSHPCSRTGAYVPFSLEWPIEVLQAFYKVQCECNLDILLVI